MAFAKISVTEFLEQATNYPVLDVRSPGEYIHAHIPGAYSLPLFSDEERKVVGTAYKQESREKAIKHGLDFFGPKMRSMVEEVEKICDVRCTKYDDVKNGKCKMKNEKVPSVNGQQSSDNLNETDSSKTILVHCWRGGMRSGAVAWLLDLYGFKVYTLDGGYKAYRNWVLQQFEKDHPLKIIGGYTGSGKTEVLAQLKSKGETIIDLERLANHKGSAFGGIGQGAQPSAEMFENSLAVELHNAFQMSDVRCTMSDVNGEDNVSYQPKSQTSDYKPQTIWIEDESQRIGNINIPMDFWKTMRNKEIIFLDIPFEERLDNIIMGYGKGDKEKLINAIIRIKKRLGGSETKAAINYLLEDDLKEAFRILLTYYDKWYLKGLHSRENLPALITEIKCNKVDAMLNAQMVLQHKRKEQNV